MARCHHNRRFDTLFARRNVIFFSQNGTVTGVHSIHLKSRYEKCAQLSTELHYAGMCQDATRRDVVPRGVHFEILCVRNIRRFENSLRANRDGPR